VVPGDLRRGEIYIFDLSSHGFEKDRPVVVVQNNRGNRYSSDTIVVPCRDIKGGKLLPIHVAVAKGAGGLKKDSVVDTGIIHTVSKSQLGPRVGNLSAEDMKRVDHALRISLGT
jgi:mRNA interferase MazF